MATLVARAGHKLLRQLKVRGGLGDGGRGLRRPGSSQDRPCGGGWPARQGWRGGRGRRGLRLLAGRLPLLQQLLLQDGGAPVHPGQLRQHRVLLQLLLQHRQAAPLPPLLLLPALHLLLRGRPVPLCPHHLLLMPLLLLLIGGHLVCFRLRLAQRWPLR